LAKQIGVSIDVFPPEDPYLTWVQEFNPVTYDRVQETFIDIGGILEYDSPLAFEQFADDRLAKLALRGC